MASKKNENTPTQDLAFQSTTAAADFAYWLIEKACFSFLAVTTGVMSYNSFQGIIKQNVPPNLYYVAVGTVVLAIYLIIDHNLSGSFRNYWNNTNNARHHKNARYAKKFLDVTILLVLLRFGLTITASWWSAGEVADMTTSRPDHQNYLNQLSQHSESSSVDKDNALKEMKALRKSEPTRLAKAKRAGQTLIDNSVQEGSVHQIDMWKRKPVFFDALSPTSKYYRQNKAFADKVHAAQRKAEQMVLREKDKTKQAERLYYAITADSTGLLLAGNIATVINSDNSSYTSKLKRRTNFILRLDIVCALLGFLVMRLRYLRKKASGIEDAEKTISFILAKYIDQKNRGFLCWLEDRLGVDIDGNGTVGTVGLRTPTPPPTGGGNGTGTGTERVQERQKAQNGTGTGTARPQGLQVLYRTRPNVDNRTCSECDTDISHRKSTATTCGDACRKARKKRLDTERKAQQRAS